MKKQNWEIIGWMAYLALLMLIGWGAADICLRKDHFTHNTITYGIFM